MIEIQVIASYTRLPSVAWWRYLNSLTASDTGLPREKSGMSYTPSTGIGLNQRPSTLFNKGYFNS